MENKISVAKYYFNNDIEIRAMRETFSGLFYEEFAKGM